MLESRSAYGYYGSSGGVTGEVAPSDYHTIEREMPYYKFKRDYPTCEHYGYNAKKKTIIVRIPEERQTGNFGNKYQLEIYDFKIVDCKTGIQESFEQKAKNYKNALANVKRWGKKLDFEVVGLCGRTTSDEPHSFISQYGVTSVVGKNTDRDEWYKSLRNETRTCYVKCEVCGNVHLASDIRCQVCDVKTKY